MHIGKRHLDALTGIKIIAVLCVFLWHAPIQRNGWPDLGARCCELLFVASGFLVAYNRFDLPEGNIRDASLYVWNKVKKLYPVYALGLVISIIALILQTVPYGASCFTSLNAAALPIHLVLSQSWIPGISMIYDRPAWFLSTLLVCYFGAPFIAKIVHYFINRCGFVVGSLTSFFLFTLFRLLIEFGNRIDSNAFNINLHVSPIVRILEFAMAYVVGVWFLRINAKQQKKSSKILFVLFSLLELCAIGIVIAAIVRCNDTWMRGYYVLLFCAFVFLLSFGRGMISKVLSTSVFSFAGRIEMEFFLLHQPIIQIVLAALAIVGIHWEKKRHYLRCLSQF